MEYVVSDMSRYSFVVLNLYPDFLFVCVCVSSKACVLKHTLTYFPGGSPRGPLLRKHKKKFRVCISVTHCAF